MSDSYSRELSRQAAARAALGLGLREADPAAIDALADGEIL